MQAQVAALETAANEVGGAERQEIQAQLESVKATANRMAEVDKAARTGVQTHANMGNN